MIKCITCQKEIEEGKGFFNYPTGAKCSKCGDTVTIGKHQIPASLIEEYRGKVKYLRRATTISIGRDDPLIVQRALQERIKLHKKIYEAIGISYEKNNASEESIKFNEALERFLL